MSLKVLQLGPVPPPEGGISRNVFAIRDEVQRRGGICSIVATSKSSEIRADTDVYRPHSAVSMIRQIRALDFDVLHLHIGGDISLRVIAMAFVATLLARRSILTVHSGAFPDSDAGKHASTVSLRGAIFRRFDRIIAINERLADVYRRFGVNEMRIEHILPFALQDPDPAIIVPDDLKRFAAAHSPLLISVGGLERDYDPLLSVAAMDDIIAEHPSAGLLIVGDGSMRFATEEAIEASGNGEHILLAGNVEHAITLHLINSADMLLRTTLFDGDAISVREALFFGTPVIATDNKMRPEGVNLIPTGDKQALIETVKTLVNKESSTVLSIRAETDNIAAIVNIYEALREDK